MFDNRSEARQGGTFFRAKHYLDEAVAFDVKEFKPDFEETIAGKKVTHDVVVADVTVVTGDDSGKEFKDATVAGTYIVSKRTKDKDGNPSKTAPLKDQVGKKVLYRLATPNPNADRPIVLLNEPYEEDFARAEAILSGADATGVPDDSEGTPF